MSKVSKRVGVLALQGGVSEHVAALRRVGAEPVEVKTPTQLAEVDAIVLPGGESTVIDRLARTFGLRDPLRAAIAEGMPAFGTCAGLILLANDLENPAAAQQTFGGLDVTVRRNAFGSQQASFDATVEVRGIGALDVSFIRAPIVTCIGSGVEVIATLADGTIVGVSEGRIIGVSFHPEVAGDDALHAAFVASI